MTFHRSESKLLGTTTSAIGLDRFQDKWNRSQSNLESRVPFVLFACYIANFDTFPIIHDFKDGTSVLTISEYRTKAFTFRSNTWHAVICFQITLRLFQCICCSRNNAALSCKSPGSQDFGIFNFIWVLTA